MRLDLEANLAAANRNSGRNFGRQNNDQARNQPPPRQQAVPTLNCQPTDGSTTRGGGQGGNDGHDGGQGRGQMGRGHGGCVPGVHICQPNHELGSFYLENLNAVNLMPTNGRYPICTDWINVGQECTKSYGTCDKVHAGFDRIT